ncbi:hypothetical protein [Paraburkholderia caribensis]|uniref:hypothetical protein n=1 Tax=Paraburkholderia caribensis TaxID=75105 RepID=UPI000B1FCD89|nr:hypothetical protein [Paraburkholderia caribensis]
MKPTQPAITSAPTNRESNPRPWLANGEQARLLSRYPLFFRAVHHPSAYPSNMAHFGIQCGSGWYAIIEELAREVEEELRVMWEELIELPTSLALVDETLLLGRGVYPIVPVCTDIFQTSGEMSVVVTDGHVCGVDTLAQIRGSIEKAITKSRKTCESCGTPGKYRQGYLRRVYCDACVGPLAEQEGFIFNRDDAKPNSSLHRSE